MANVEKRLLEMGIILNDPKPCDHPILRTKQCGSLLFVSGHGSLKIKGKVGGELSVEEGYAAARECCIHCLEAIRQKIGDLDRVKNFLRVFGMINCEADFTRQPDVMNGVSDLLIAAFGEEIGSHTRSAVGMNSLPGGIAAEVEMILEVEA